MNLLLVYVKETKALAVINVEDYRKDSPYACLGLLSNDPKQRNMRIKEAASLNVNVDLNGNVRFN